MQHGKFSRLAFQRRNHRTPKYSQRADFWSSLDLNFEFFPTERKTVHLSRLQVNIFCEVVEAFELVRLEVEGSDNDI